MYKVYYNTDNNMSDPTYSELSIVLTKQIDKIEKKKNGIYFTPPKTVMRTIQLLEPHMPNIKDVLEPSCGSCEYVTQLNRQYPNVNITGIELNPIIFESIKTLENPTIKLHNVDYLTNISDNKYDLIIGNPPYFVMKKKEVDKVYHPYFDGRPNIFLLFIIKSLHSLNAGGILSFVLPKNFLNCLYYNKTRKYINDNFHILHIVECKDEYIETQQETIILIIQNIVKENKEYCLDIGQITIFGIPENIIKLQELYTNSSTLSNLGFTVSVGNVVWNQCKDELTDDSTKTLLVYSSDIKDKKLEIKTYSNKFKKNYINKKGDTGALLVLNRGYGVGKYSFEFCLINSDLEYLVENHLMCIKYINPIAKDALVHLYNQIIKSFEHPNTHEFIQLYFNNNAINTTELCKILPIYGINN